MVIKMLDDFNAKNIIRWRTDNILNGLRPATKLELRILGFHNNVLEHNFIYQIFPASSNYTDISFYNDKKCNGLSDANFMRNALIKRLLRLGKTWNLSHGTISELRPGIIQICSPTDNVKYILDKKTGFFEMYYRGGLMYGNNDKIISDFEKQSERLKKLFGTGIAIVSRDKYENHMENALLFAASQSRKWFRRDMQNFMIQEFGAHMK